MVKTLGILGAIWICVVTFVGSKGVDKISKVTSVGGTAVTLLNIVLLGGGMLVVALTGELAEPITNIAQSFTNSPSPNYQTPLAILSFLTFAVFAFGGLEVLGGLVDQTENAEKTFPKGLAISAIVISVGYALGIFACGMFTNWSEVLGGEHVNMANATYILMSNLGFKIGQGLGLAETTSLAIGAWTARFVGLSMFLSLTGAFFTLSYSPLKTLIQGAPKEVWPGKLGEIKNGMPINAMIVQAILVVAMILIVSFGGSNAAEFFAILTLMTNVAMTIPYMFLSAAFPVFKKKQLKGELDKPFVVYKSYGAAMIASVIVTAIIGFANIFTIIEPALSSSEGMSKTITMIGGPLVFSVVGFGLFTFYEIKHVKKSKKSKESKKVMG